MHFFTRSQYELLLCNGARRDVGKDPAPVVKLAASGTGCIWLLTELDPLDPLCAFGLCDLGMGFPELGSVSLTELVGLRSIGIVLNPDPEFSGKYPISVYARAARECGWITEDETVLRRAYAPPRHPSMRPV